MTSSQSSSSPLSSSLLLSSGDLNEPLLLQTPGASHLLAEEDSSNADDNNLQQHANVEDVMVARNLHLSVDDQDDDNNNNNNNNNTPGDDDNDSSSDVVDDLQRDIIFCCGHAQNKWRMNHNVFLTLLLAVLYGISDNLWGGTVFCAYLKRLGNGQNEWVGNLEAVQGLAGLFSALPVGYLADKWGRSLVIRAGGLLIALTSIIHLAALDWIGVDEQKRHDSKSTMTVLFLVMALWGIGGGIINGPCQAIYADSTPAGSRSQYYNYLFACYMLSSCLGPLLSIVLFQTLGDHWKLSDLRVIVVVGLCMEFFNSLVMLLFDDSKTLDEEGEDDEQEPSSQQQQSTNILRDVLGGGEEESSSPDMTERLLPQTGSGDEPETPPPVAGGAPPPQPEDNSSGDAVDNNNDDTDEQQSIMKRRRRRIPFIMSISGFIVAIGSGMTVKFFPLFFKDEVGMSPTQVQLVYVAVPIFMVVCSSIAIRVARTFGRVQTNLVMSALGLSCLYSMVFFKSFLDARPLLLVPIYVTRTALMNAPYPLCESILMDFVPKHERARWKSLEAITSFGWCGSAALGGYLSDRYDYTRTFLITAIVQTTGMLVFSTLLPLVPRREEEQQQRGSSNNREETQ